jgi:hypothetical protein
MMRTDVTVRYDQIHDSFWKLSDKARFRTIPVNEFIDGVTITPLGVQAVEAIQDCGFGVLEVWQAQDRF